MSMQNSTSSAPRNTSRAVGAGGSTKQTKISLPAPHSTAVTADVKGAAPHAPGAAVKGFSGTGLIKGKV